MLEEPDINHEKIYAKNLDDLKNVNPPPSSQKCIVTIYIWKLEFEIKKEGNCYTHNCTQSTQWPDFQDHKWLTYLKVLNLQKGKGQVITLLEYADSLSYLL